MNHVVKQVYSANLDSLRQDMQKKKKKKGNKMMELLPIIKLMHHHGCHRLVVDGSLIP